MLVKSFLSTVALFGVSRAMSAPQLESGATSADETTATLEKRGYGAISVIHSASKDLCLDDNNPVGTANAYYSTTISEYLE